MQTGCQLVGGMVLNLGPTASCLLVCVLDPLDGPMAPAMLEGSQDSEERTCMYRY